MQAAIVGAGSFGTAIANIIAAGGVPAHLWMRDEAQLRDIRAHGDNRRYLPGHALHEGVMPTTDLEQAVVRSDVLFVTVPSASFRTAAGELRPFARPGTCVVSGTKGIEASGFRLMSQILAEVLPEARIGVISGPNLAEEIAGGKFAGTVVASADEQLRATVQGILKSPTFRVYGSADVYGVELGGALKNIYAIICGIATEIGIGQNGLAMLITRSLAEMNRFAVSLGANPLTLLGLAGVGDLFATCTSPLSRNFQVGKRLAAGASAEEAIGSLGKLAEGVNTVRAVYVESAKRGVYMPLAHALHRLLFEGAVIDTVVRGLMAGEQRPDVDIPASAARSAGR